MTLETLEEQLNTFLNSSSLMETKLKELMAQIEEIENQIVLSTTGAAGIRALMDIERKKIAQPVGNRTPRRSLANPEGIPEDLKT
jgi:hypothetical protein